MTLRDKVLACFYGKNIGGTLGMPFEGCETRLDLDYYRPEPTTPLPNDDLELQLVWLDAFARHGLALDSAKLGDQWLKCIDMHWDEYGVAMANLRRGVKPPLSGYHNNNFADGMGAAIRSEVWASLFPGRPATAAWFARADAEVDHYGDGVWSEIFLAAAQSALYGGGDIPAALEAGLAFLPEESRARRAVVAARDLHKSGAKPEAALDALMKEFYSVNFTDCVMNLAIIAYALYYGDADFEKSILLAVNGGEDADCTAATVGAFLGILHGSAGIPERWSKKLGNAIAVSDGLKNIDPPKTIEELTDAIMALAAKLPSGAWPELPRPYRMAPPADFSQNIPWTINNRPVKADGIRIDAKLYNAVPTQPVRLKATVSFPRDERVFLMVSSRALFVAHWDGQPIMRKGCQARPVPAVHRVRGGRVVPLDVKAGTRYTLEIEINPTWPMPDIYVGFFDWGNRHVDAQFHE